MLTSEAILPQLCESEMAEMRRAWGDHVHFANGHYWVMTSPGFYRATHWLARMPFNEAGKPARFCWGFHTTISPVDAMHANGTLPLHVMYDLPQYDINALSPRRRNKLRNCYKQVVFAVITDPERLLTDGYEVMQLSQQRTGYRRWTSRQQFRRYVNSFLSGPRGLVVGGLVDGRLRGMAFCFAVGSTAYIDSIDIASDALKTNMSSGLVFEIAQIARRSGKIVELVNSPHTPEKPSLTSHKLGMGFDLAHIPSRIWFMPPMEVLVRLLKPEAHYRIIGKRQERSDSEDSEAESLLGHRRMAARLEEGH